MDDFVPSFKHQDLWSKIYDESPIGINFVDNQGRWLSVNKKMTDITEYSEAELLDMSYRDLTYFKDLGPHEQMLRKLGEGEINHFEILKRYLTKSGKLVWVRVIVWSLKNDDETIYLITNVIPLKNGERNKLEQVGEKEFQLRPSASISEFISDNLKECITGVATIIAILVSLGVALWGNIERSNYLERRLKDLEQKYNINLNE